MTRLGSVKAAATTLGVSEPAVSQALAALRQHLGDPLITKGTAGMELTATGQRVIGIASQMVSLSVDAEQAARSTTNAPDLLRVVASSSIADSIGPAVLQSFTSKVPNVEINLGVATAQEMTALLHERLADVALGAMPLADTAGLVVQPMLRWRLVVVGRSSDPRARNEVDLGDLRNERWLTDPSGRDPATIVNKLLQRIGVPDDRIRVFPNQDAALAAAMRSEGIVAAVDHLLDHDLQSRGLARLRIRGLPLEAMWHAMTISSDRRSPMSARLLRFLSSPDALMEMHHAGGGVPANRFRPPVYVTIWS